MCSKAESPWSGGLASNERQKEATEIPILSSQGKEVVTSGNARSLWNSLERGRRGAEGHGAGLATMDSYQGSLHSYLSAGSRLGVVMGQRGPELAGWGKSTVCLDI